LKGVFFILLITISGLAFGQRNYSFGIVKDSLSDEPMVGVHIRNILAGSITSTNEEGKFRIPVKVGDTLVLSNVGYQTLAWAVDSSWLNQEEITLKLPPTTIYLDEVVVGKFPEYERFKEDIIQLNVEDTSFQFYGLPKVVVAPKSSSPSLGISGPISGLYKVFSKREKEKKKMNQIMQRKHVTTKAYLKFNREWVAENTGLEGDQLTSFIEYCDFSVDYLADATEFDIQQRMLEILPEFLENYGQG